MNVEFLPEYLQYTLGTGISVGTDKTSLVQNSLRILQDQGKFRHIYFWGIINGTSKDYYVAYGVRNDALDRVFYYSLDGMSWLLIPDPLSNENAPALTLDCRTRFSGDPMLLREVEDITAKEVVHLEGGGDVEAESQVHNLEFQFDHEDGSGRNLKEEDRLACVVTSITEEAFILPRRALFKVPNKIGSVVFNKFFQGLNDMESTKLNNYVHYREPRNKWNTNLLESSAANYSTDFLDAVDADVPRHRKWSVVHSYDQMIVINKCLLWHGSVFFHVVDTPRYGNCYFGYGLKNYDLPFYLSPSVS
uniref:Radial spoke head protein 9 homolog n=1 Tax=Cacopsylla melanoneura TaxID=428564 RepID=A0A8D9ADV6_9HEMI